MTHVPPTRRRRLVVTGIWAASTAGAVALVLATLPLAGDEVDVSFMLVDDGARGGHRGLCIRRVRCWRSDVAGNLVGTS